MAQLDHGRAQAPPIVRRFREHSHYSQSRLVPYKILPRGIAQLRRRRREESRFRPRRYRPPVAREPEHFNFGGHVPRRREQYSRGGIYAPRAHRRRGDGSLGVPPRTLGGPRGTVFRTVLRRPCPRRRDSQVRNRPDLIRGGIGDDGGRELAPPPQGGPPPLLGGGGGGGAVLVFFLGGSLLML